MSRQVQLGQAVAVPAPVELSTDAPPVPRALELPPAVLLTALTRLAVADTRGDVAAAVPALLVEEPGVRACAVVARDGAHVVVLGSAGYACGTMGAGATLPLDAGLPVTDAVRCGRTVERGSGPAWVAVPFGGRRAAGALLLSLVGPPPARPQETAALVALARAIGGALERAAAQESAFLDLALVTATLAPSPSPSGKGATVRLLPHDGVVGADVALRLDDRGVTWLVVADVHRSGLEAAVLARTVSTAVSAVVPHVRQPGAVVHAVRTALADSSPGRVAAISVARVEGGDVALLASHAPPTVLLTGGRVVPLGGEAAGVTVVRPPDDAVLVLHTDGLAQRAGRTVSLSELLATAPTADLDTLADHLVRAAGTAGPATDDVAVLVARPAELG